MDYDLFVMTDLLSFFFCVCVIVKYIIVVTLASWCVIITTGTSYAVTGIYICMYLQTSTGNLLHNNYRDNVIQAMDWINHNREHASHTCIAAKARPLR